MGEIKGKTGLTSAEEALFLIRGLNARDIFPDWIAMNNGTTHGIEAGDAGIQVDLTRSIHEALMPYHVSGAQHGTSGNNSDRLRSIAAETQTTKANVATALQMISWGIRVNDYGNAFMNAAGRLDKVVGEGVTEEMWAEMTAYADAKNLKAGDYKKLNLPFENKLSGLPKEIRQRMEDAVERFTYTLLVDVFNAKDTAKTAMDILLDSGSYDLGVKARRIENPADWTDEKIYEKAKQITADKGAHGNFDD